MFIDLFDEWTQQLLVLVFLIVAILFYFWMPRKITNHKKNKAVIVITGCDSGFGNALSLELSQQGYHVISTCMTDNGMQSIQGRVAKVLLCDITSQDNVNVLANEVDGYLQSNRELRMWALINNAGIAPLGNMDWMKISLFKNAIDVNYIGAINVAKALLPMLKRTKYSRIINLSSVAGLIGSPAYAPYCGSKHALEGAMKCLRMEMQPWNVRVVNVNPSFMKTPLITSSAENMLREYQLASQEIQQQYPVQHLSKAVNQVTMLQEDPDMVVKVIANIMTIYDPPFNYYIGALANACRLWLMFPHSIRERFDYFIQAPLLPHPEVVKAYQNS